MSSSRELAVYESAGALTTTANASTALVAKSEEHEHRLAHALKTVKAQVAELMLSMRNGRLFVLQSGLLLDGMSLESRSACARNAAVRLADIQGSQSQSVILK